MYYLGIDGGGTKTAFEVIDGCGDILSAVKTSTCSYIQIGRENYGKVVREGAEAACRQAGIQLSDIASSCIGIPSFGEIAADVPDLLRITEASLGRSVKCVNDVEVAWAGSLACEPGINLLAGTGSMGYGVDRKGHSARSGGWGSFCGDEGSAYWLGKKLIELFTKEADGRLKKSAVYDLVRQEFGIASDFGFLQVIYHRMKLQRDKIAQLQLLLDKAASLGDGNAVLLYRQAAYELSLIVLAIIHMLNFGAAEEIAVSYSGGVFKAGKFIFDPLEERLRGHRIVLKKPLLTPVTGAALSALLSAGGVKTAEIVENLKRRDG